MNPGVVWAILRKDLSRAPRSGIVAMALLYPILLTLIVQVVFGGIFDPPPRIGLAGASHSKVASAIISSPSAKVTTFAETEAMWAAVRRGDLDLGLSFGAGFDEALTSRQPPPIEYHTSTLANGQGLLKAEAVVGRAFLEVLPAPPIEMMRIRLSDEPPKSWTDRLLPMLVLLTFFVAGTFLTGFALVDEKLRGTMRAILTTPASILDLLLAKSLFSYGIAILCALLTLAFNDALGSLSVALAVAMTIAALMTIEVGIVLGLLSRDISALYGAVKGIGPLLAVSALPYIWDGFPIWIAKAFPTWYVIAPIVAIVNDQASLSDVAFDLSVAVALCAVLVLVMYAVARRTRERLDAAS